MGLESAIAIAHQNRNRVGIEVGDGQIGLAIVVKVSHRDLIGVGTSRQDIVRGRLERAITLA